MLYYNARYYDPALGRFVSADSIVPGAGSLTMSPHDAVATKAWGERGGGPLNPQELNRYSYVNNNPMRNTDPTGHFVWIAVGFAVGAGIDLAVQLHTHGGDFSKVNVTQTLVSGAVGAIGVATGGLVTTAGYSVVKSVLANAAFSAAASGAGAMAQNALQDPSLPKADPMVAMAYGGVLGGAGAAVGEAVTGVVQAGRAVRHAINKALVPKDADLMLNSSAIIRPERRRTTGDVLIGAGNAAGIVASNSGPVVTAPSNESQ